MSVAQRLLLVMICAARAQAQQFDVVSIKPSAPGARGAPTMYLAQGGRFTATSTSLRMLLQKAFAIRDFQITGAPDWIDSERYDIAAKTEDDRSVDEEQYRALLQALLTGRFKLMSRMESREMPIYALNVAKNGPKLKPARDEGAPGSGVRFGGIGRLVGLAASTKQLAEGLSDIRLNGAAVVDRPVLDETGLNGLYDFTLIWAPVASDLPESSIFTALEEQLGLKLNSRKAQLPILIIEHAEKPSQN